MFAPSVAFVDLETTGMSAVEDRITEVGVVRVEAGRIVDEWSSLVRPDCPIPPAIQALTGISDAMVADAPPFAELAAELRRRLEGALFVAHNARFDYGFVKQEFRRLGERFSARVLCTARLSRRLFPEERRHHLDALIDRHRLPLENRHRALGDARLLWHFACALREVLTADAIGAAVDRVSRIPSLPPQLPPDALEGIPEEPGVYLFYGLNALPIYIGKSINLRERVGSHFSGDYRSTNDQRISAEIQRIEWRQTAGELGALLLESRLIKELMPLHNRLRRRRVELGALHVGRDPCVPRWVPADAVDEAGLDRLYGPFASRRSARETLRSLADEHALCWTALGLERRNGPCFARQLRKCSGACVGVESLAAHHDRLLAGLTPLQLERWPFDGAAALGECRSGARHVALQVFNHWRWIGTAGDEAELQALARVEPARELDFDVYRITRGFLRRGARWIEIPRG